MARKGGKNALYRDVAKKKKKSALLGFVEEGKGGRKKVQSWCVFEGKGGKKVQCWGVLEVKGGKEKK